MALIKFKNELGDFEFQDVKDLREFLKKPPVEDFDMQQFGYLVSNVTKHTKLSAYCSKGLKALVELRERGMDAVVRELRD